MFNDINYLSAIVFLFLLVISLISFIFGKKNKNEFVKFIGGFTVVILAIVSQNPWVYSIAVVVSGLIIASERFMSLLVALLKGDKQFLTSENFIGMLENMTGKEKEIKIEKEVQEIKANEKIDEQCLEIKTEEFKKEKKQEKLDLKKDEIINIKNDEYKIKIPLIENKALEKYQKTIPFNVRRNVKMGNLMLDGFAVNQNKNTLYFIEVKSFPKIIGNKGGIRTDQIIHMLNTVIPNIIDNLSKEIYSFTERDKYNYVVMMILVLNTSKDLNSVKEKVLRMNERFAISNPSIKVKYVFYNLPKLLEE